MLGYCRLRDLHPRNDSVDRPFPAIVEKADDLSTPPLRDGIKNIGSRRCSSHVFILYIIISEYMSSITTLGLNKCLVSGGGSCTSACTPRPIGIGGLLRK